MVHQQYNVNYMVEYVLGTFQKSFMNVYVCYPRYNVYCQTFPLIVLPRREIMESDVAF